MDPKNVKALYFRGYAQLKVLDHEAAVKTIEECLEVDPAHGEAKKLLVLAKKERNQERDKQGKQFS